MFRKLLVLTLFCSLSACTTVHPPQDNASAIAPTPDSESLSDKKKVNPAKDTTSTLTTDTEYGEASFYSDNLQNQKTANGHLYQHHLKTAAHKTLPFGSSVKVTNVDNGESVIVEINDRGTFHGNRIIDLSKSAFTSIGESSSGVIDVKIEVIQD